MTMEIQNLKLDCNHLIDLDLLNGPEEAGNQLFHRMDKYLSVVHICDMCHEVFTDLLSLDRTDEAVDFLEFRLFHVEDPTPMPTEKRSKQEIMDFFTNPGEEV